MVNLFCRICLNKTGTVSLYSAESNEVQYCTKLARLLNVSMNGNDGLPKHICDDCLAELNSSYQFVLKCEASEKALGCFNHIAFNHYEPKIEPDIIKTEVLKSNNDIKCVETDLDIKVFSDTEADINYYESKFEQNGVQETTKKQTIYDKQVQCMMCGLLTKSKSSLEIHMRVHTREKPFICDQCDSRFSSKGNLKRHVDVYHSIRERKFICETCGNSFFSKNDIIIHIRVHTNEEPYACKYCPKRFKQLTSRNRHETTHTGSKPFACSICNKRFSYHNLVIKHQSVHTDERKFTCNLCNKSLKTKASLHVHMSLHTIEKQNICSVCGMSFSIKGNLQSHIRRVHSEKSGQCSVCMKTFSNLEVHMRRHTGEKPFICPICNTPFALKGALKYHMFFRHEASTKFKCTMDECNKTFPTAYILECHKLKYHSKANPFVCRYCPKAFYRISDLTRHLRNH